MKKLLILLLSGLLVTSAYGVAPKADKIRLADAGDIITATEVEGALQENRTALDLNTTHRSSTGEDHTYIDQDVTSGSTPTFTNTNFTEATDKNYVTDAQQAVIVNTSGTNTGDVTVTDSDELDLTLTGQDLTATLKAGSIDETKLDTSVNASLDLADSAIQTETDPLSLHINGTNVPTADYSWTTSLTTTGTLSGGTLTDGTATLTGGELTATSIVVGDNEPIEIGVGGLSGALGSDGKLYSDGTNVRLQVESPYSMFEVQNPDITFEYFQVHATAPFYIPVLHFGKGGAFDGLGVIDYYLYVQDISHTNDGVIFIPNKNFPTDKHTGLLSFISASNQLQFLTQGAGSYIKLDPYSHTETDQDFKINVDGKKLYFGAADDASITYDGTNLLIDPKEVGSGYLQVDGEILATDKVMFTQTDGNEYIDSLADGYMDYGATTAHRFNNDVTVGGDISLLTGKLYLGADNDLEIYHNGINGYIDNSTGGLNLDSVAGIYFKLYGTTRVVVSGNSFWPNADNVTSIGLSNRRFTDTYSIDYYNKSDSGKTYFGAGDDAYIEYDGTDMRILTDAVGASDLIVDCGTDKTIELAETVWKDINLGAAQLSKPSSSQPDTDSFVDEAGADTGIETLAFAVGEKVHGSFEIQHDYKQGSDFIFHVHWQGITAPSGTDNVQFRLTYTLMRDGATLDATTTIDSADCPIDTQYEASRCDFTAITGTNTLIGDQFLFTLERVASTGDAYAGDALLATAGLHYQIDTIGSRQIGTK